MSFTVLYSAIQIKVISTAIMGASLFSLGTFFYIKENQTVQCQDSEIVFGLCEPQVTNVQIWCPFDLLV